MSSHKPTVIVAHGAFHEPAHFVPLATVLVSKGYRVISVWLPSGHYEKLNQPVPKGLVEDIDAIRGPALFELNKNPNTDVLILAHSYSSLPGSAACQGLDKDARRSAGHNNGIAGLLVISGLLVPAGKSTVEWAAGWTGHQIVPTMTFHETTTQDGHKFTFTVPRESPGPVEFFYHDVPADEAQKWASMLKPFVFDGHHAPVPYAGYLVVPTYFLVCEDDRALPADVQRYIVNEASKQMPEGKEVIVTSIQSGHSPFLSRVEETADWVRRCAGEKV
nr:hypothetical protein LTR18_000110 [Exophiala xenobiotica]